MSRIHTNIYNEKEIAKELAEAYVAMKENRVYKCSDFTDLALGTDGKNRVLANETTMKYLMRLANDIAHLKGRVEVLNGEVKVLKRKQRIRWAWRRGSDE